ncbi:glyoxylate reductase/hydroxypyruvate reductase-like isoform X2 [Eublepharis macularius]|uniref:Glyoxylate reductase/hydroxypyruvate reductase-like isoform X2 n=1 Tax=Eublepharis macularius TaxID=481883 RepID=A0AA97L457_EUBMA|nr:glyoxylate reductase/hydroxypyruvate reductase-like isoform X2 [Eublepharis macularius]
MAKQDRPYTLINVIGGPIGVYEDHVEFLETHLKLITMEEFLENKQVLSQKIEAMYMWFKKPEATRELLQSLPNLKVIANSGVGVDHLDLKLISSFGVKVANTPFAVANPTADLGIALLMASARRIVEGYQIALSPETKYFEADWLGEEINVDEEQAVGAIYCQNKEDLLQQSDFVMLTVILTPQTRNLIGKKELELMKPTATLINVCRGQVVDQDALLNALQNGVIKAAALDVTYPEPLPRDHPLLKLKNIIITPHIGSATVKARRLMMISMVESILDGVNGLPVPNEVHG